MEVTAAQMRERTKIAILVREDYLKKYSESKIKEIDKKIQKASDCCKFAIIVKVPEEIKPMVVHYYINNGFSVDFEADVPEFFLKEDEIRISWE